MSFLNRWTLHRLRKRLALAKAQDREDRSRPGDTQVFYAKRMKENAKLIQELEYQIAKLEDEKWP